jgi:hypothetical protein
MGGMGGEDVDPLSGMEPDEEQRWFWSARWQQMEREAEDDIAAGRFATFDDVESFLAALDAQCGESSG